MTTPGRMDMDDFGRMSGNSAQSGDDDAVRETTEIAFTGSSKIAWLQEIAFSFTKLIVIGVTCIVIVMSVIAKAQWLDIMVRAGVSILVLGLLGWLFNLILGKFLVDVKYSELEEANAKLEEENSQNVELEA